MKSLPPCIVDSEPIWLLGKKFQITNTEEEAAFMDYWNSLIYFSYRSNFPEISNSKLTTDAGWGCTLRSAQMLLANALLLHFLGPASNRIKNRTDVLELNFKLIQWFNDHNNAPYSVHSIANEGLRFNKSIGQWLGPDTISKIISNLVESCHPDGDRIQLYVSQGGVIYRDQLFHQKHTGLIILIPLRLGVTKFNKAYIKTILSLFSLPFFLGIIGGRPSSSFFFVGCHKQDLLYLDPHTTQPYVDLSRYAGSKFLDEDKLKALLSNYHTNDIRRISINMLDPSLTIGFYFRHVEDFDNCRAKIHEVFSSEDALPIVTIDSTTPNYQETEDFFFSEDSL